MDMTPSLSDILGLIQKLPMDQRAALYNGVTAGGAKDAREEVVELARLISALPQSVRETIVKELSPSAK